MRIAKNAWDPIKQIFQPPISEEMVLKEIMTRLWLEYRIKVWRITERIPVKGKRWQRLSTPGLPDLLGWLLLPGSIGANASSPIMRDLPPNRPIPLLIEVKRPGGKRREMQERFIAEAKADGCCSLFAESWEDVVQSLKEFGVEHA